MKDKNTKDRKIMIANLYKGVELDWKDKELLGLA